MRTVLLDLDGTLTDPQEGIVASYDHAMAALGRPPVPPEQRWMLIGPPLREVFTSLGVPGEQVEEAVTAYRAYFAPRGMLENRVYDGIPEALADLRAAGARLAVATSKPEPYARRILEHFGLDHWFEHVAGATLDGRVGAKADVIALALQGLGADPGPHVVMVGDRSHDVLGAAAHGLGCIGVAWGFAAPRELEDAGAVAIARDPGDLVRLLVG